MRGRPFKMVFLTLTAALILSRQISTLRGEGKNEMEGCFERRCNYLPSYFLGREASNVWRKGRSSNYARIQRVRSIG